MKEAITKFLGLCYNSWYDLSKFWRYATNHRKGGVTSEQRLAAIGATYHVLEKGLSMPDPRPGFGQDVVHKLIVLLMDYRDAGEDMNAMAIRSAHGALKAYFEFNRENSFDLGEVAGLIRGYLNDVEVSSFGGIHTFTRKQIQSESQCTFDRLAFSRHSIRHFSDEPVSMDLITEAVRIAHKTPTVCNRQSYRVYISADRKVKDRLLAHQSGNRGFGHTADKCLVITASLETFFASSERNQAFIDGGLFSMSLMYALHYLKIGSCPLNWSVNALRDKRLRKEFSIPESEVIIMMIVIGHLPDVLNIPQSNRTPLDNIIRTLH